MANLIIIHDTKKEMAALVNAETRQAWGPAVIGEGADVILQAFIDAAPFDITLMDATTATLAFEGFLEGLAEGVPTTPSTPDTGAVVPVDGSDADLADNPVYGSEDAGESALEPGAADVVPDAPAPVAVRAVDCFNCNGTGTIQFGGDEPSQRCNTCQGTGRLAQAV